MGIQQQAAQHTPLQRVRAALVCAFVALLATLSLVPKQAWAADASAVQGKTYTIATDTTFAPFEYRDNGQLVGIDMDLIRAIADEEGFSVNIQSLGFNAALQAVTSGTADMAIAGASITDERKQMYDFSDPYFDSGVQMAVPKNSNISSYEDLAGKTVTAKTGAEGEAFAKSIADQYGFTVYSVDQASTMYQLVAAGQAVAVFDDYPVIAYGISQGQDLKIVTQMEKGNSYGALVAKGKNQDLLAAFNEGLAKCKADGTYDQIMNKYLGDSNNQSSGASSSDSGSTKDNSFWGLVVSSMPALMEGLKNTVLITLMSFAFALLLGNVLGLFMVSPNHVLHAIAKVYVWLFRGTPILVWAFFFYFGVPQLTGIPMNIWVAGCLTLSLNSGAYITEIVRGAIEAVDPGQAEAARSLGASYGLTMRKVILPQAINIAVPSVINQLIIMVKDSSLLLAIGFGELLYQAQQIYAANFRVTETLIIVAAIYLIAISILTWLANIASRRLNN
ncbi:MAG: amino acid ABC transporter substrate-binding protein/permease [Coriobacteriales bacterium]|nr:amino acid ABC transporter substrate-binding protein/permease [Coriobacteriales bacterium]